LNHNVTEKNKTAGRIPKKLLFDVAISLKN